MGTRTRGERRIPSRWRAGARASAGQGARGRGSPESGGGGLGMSAFRWRITVATATLLTFVFLFVSDENSAALTRVFALGVGRVGGAPIVGSGGHRNMHSCHTNMGSHAVPRF